MKTTNRDLIETLRLQAGDLAPAVERLLTGPKGLGIDDAFLRVETPSRAISAALARVGRPPPLHARIVEATSAVRQQLRARLKAPAATGVRFLLRVDDFPRWDLPLERFLRFHEAMDGVPYLLAVTPRLDAKPLDPASRDERILTAEERQWLASAIEGSVELALHGLTHRTRHARRHSELAGLGFEATLALVDAGLEALALPAHAFVPPFNDIGPEEFRAIGERFGIVSAGGRESVRSLGAFAGPVRLGGVTYAPSYAPAYGRAKEILPFVEALLRDEAEEVVVPITLHWAWEDGNDHADVRTLVAALRDRVISWGSFQREAAVRLQQPAVAGKRH